MTDNNDPNAELTAEEVKQIVARELDKRETSDGIGRLRLLKWVLIIGVLAAAIPAIIFRDPNDAERLFATYALTAALVGLIGALACFWAHSDNDAVDWFGKALLFLAGFLIILIQLFQFVLITDNDVDAKSPPPAATHESP